LYEYFSKKYSAVPINSMHPTRTDAFADNPSGDSRPGHSTGRERAGACRSPACRRA
jgi:hypothetical protein